MQGSGAGGAGVPKDLEVALSADPGAKGAWERLSPRDKQAHISDLDSAAEPYARARCIETLVHDLSLQPQGGSRK